MTVLEKSFWDEVNTKFLIEDEKEKINKRLNNLERAVKKYKWRGRRSKVS